MTGDGAPPRSPARREPAQPGPAQPDVTQAGSAQRLPAQRRSAQPGPAQPGPAQPGSAQPGSAQPGSAQPGSARRGLARWNPARLSQGKRIALVALVAAAIAAVAGLAPTAVAQPVPIAEPYVFSADDVGFAEGATTDGLAGRLDQMDTYAGDRKPILRLDLDWTYVQPCATCPLRWDKLDPVVDAAHDKGIRVLVVLGDGAPWANGGRGGDGKWFPADDTAWSGIVDRTVAHFGRKVQAYEVWNEPNFTGRGDYGDGSVTARRLRYWQLVRIAHTRVHAGCVSCLVLAGASGAGTPQSLARNDNEPAQWLEWAYANGFEATFDAVAHHPYPAWNSGLTPVFPECTTRWWNMFGPPDAACGELAAVRAVMVAHGDGGKKIWGTEFGYPSNAAEPETVRDDLEEGVRMWRALTYTGPLFLYSYRDATCEPGDIDPQCHFGLTDTGGQPKQPAYDDVSVALTGRILPSLATQRSLHTVSALRSPNGRYTLWLQADGNLVLYRDLNGTTAIRWTSNTHGGVRLTNQGDGNLVLYDAQDRAVWSTGTYGEGNSQLVLRDDGNLVLLPATTPTKPSWATRTAEIVKLPSARPTSSRAPR